MPIRANGKIIGNAQLSLSTLVICRACRSPIATLHSRQVYHHVRKGVEYKIEGVRDEVWDVRGCDNIS
jgi:hypothetical protein